MTSSTRFTEHDDVTRKIARLEETLGALEGRHEEGWINITMEERRLFAQLLRQEISILEAVSTDRSVRRERCPSCEGSGLSLDVNGEPTECPECGGDAIEDAGYTCWSEAVQAGLEAALSARPVESVGVKGLEWAATGDSDWVADSIVGQYVLNRDELSAGGCFNLWLPDADDDDFLIFTTAPEAKAVAQADYEARIRSALVSSPAPGLVEALRKIFTEHPEPEFDWSDTDGARRQRHVEHHQRWGERIALEVQRALSSITETGGAK